MRCYLTPRSPWLMMTDLGCLPVHGAGGYLIAQFLDNASNNRTDEWGGSVVNRSRFGLEVVKAVIKVFGENVSVKVSPAGGYNDMGYIFHSAVMRRFLLIYLVRSMPLQETLDTYKYFLSEVNKLKPSYVTLVRFVAAQDPVIDGKLILYRYLHLVQYFFLGKPRGTVHDVIESYGSLLGSTKVVINAGLTPEEGAGLVAAGKVDAISLGKPFISHPDLVKRVGHGKPLDNPVRNEYVYGGPGGVGYTDYPEATYERELDWKGSIECLDL